MKETSVSAGSRVAPFDLVALVASAGGIEAFARVLRDLPEDFPAAVVVAQHLSMRASGLAGILGRTTLLPIVGIEEGMPLRPGYVYVAPRRRVEILPDGTFALHDNDRGAMERPLDFLLESLADSLGPRALAVVLSGMGSDGAAGALALRRAGGTVVAQSEDTAEQPSMPLAASKNGAVNLVLPLHEIGRTLAEVLAGGRFPKPRSEVEAVETLFEGPGEARAAMRDVDWSETSIGPVIGWPTGLKAMVRTAMSAGFAMHVGWGPDFVQVYNEGFVPIMGTKHPAAAGLPYRVTWAEVVDVVYPLYSSVMETGREVFLQNLGLMLNRNGMLEESFFDVSFSPVYDEGKVGGVLSTATEITGVVRAERRLRTLGGLSFWEGDVAGACEMAIASLGENPQDVPFALLYLVDGAPHATLCASVGIEAGMSTTPRTVALQGGHPAWPLARVLKEGTVVVDDLETRFRSLHVGPWPEPPRSAVLLPLHSEADDGMAGVLVLGVSPRLPLDAKYREFLELVGVRVSAVLASAQARQKERDRLERLAELNRAKTEFFSNVSHEFRTPLTLMLGPLEELAHRREELPAPLGDEVEVAARNARRLLTLVNALLDFSRIEESRMRPRRTPTDLARLTADVASLFRSAVERAGLRLLVDCPPLSEPASVDPEMWAKIVSNLLANALKFTFEGEIAVELRELPGHLELVVRDTGVGIPKAEIPNLFRRFHRVRGARARTHEGSGIGLALVHDLVRLHLGRVRATSREGEGSAFTVWIPKGPRTVHEAIAGAPVSEASTTSAAALAEVAARWDVVDDTPPEGALDGPLDSSLTVLAAGGARVLVVDDNADLRDHLRRLLMPHFSVATAADGAEALGRLRDDGFDLVLADVMMPNLDGFGLLRTIREDERLRATPVVLLTARAGEEAAIEGLLAGADDYVVKPFSARELVARVGAQLQLARVRREAGAAIAERERRTSEILESIDDIFYSLDAEFRFTYLNRRAEQAWNRPGKSLIGKHYWTEFPAAVGSESYRIHLQAMESRQAVRYETVSPLLRRWIEVAIHPTDDGGLAVYFHDVEWRKRVEQALRESEARLQVALGAADLGTFVWHVAEDRTEEDARARAHFGLPPDSTISLAEALATTFHPDDAPRYAAAVARALDPTGPGTLREGFRVRHPDGRERWMEVSATAAFEGTPPKVTRLTGVLADVTERKRREADLALLAEVSLDLERLTSIDETMNALGAKIAAHLGLSASVFAELFLDEDRTQIDHGWHRADVPSLLGTYRLGDFMTPEFIQRCRDGEAVVVRDVFADPRADSERFAALNVGSFVTMPLVRDGERRFLLVVYRSEPHDWNEDEITLVRELTMRIWTRLERARAEEAVRKSEARFRALVSASSDVVYRMSPDWSEMRALLGKGFLADTDAPNRNWLAEYIHPEDQPRVLSEIRKAIESRSNFEFEHRVLQTDGTLGWTFSRAVPMFDEAGEVVEWFGAATDVTGRRRSEAASREGENGVGLVSKEGQVGKPPGQDAR